MFGPEILARSLSVATPTGASDALWQYHSRSDRHSKIACWGILFDLLRNCAVLREHVAGRKIGFGINHEMRDFKENRKKNLDLVLCVPNGGPAPKKPATFAELTERYGIMLSPEEKSALAELPVLQQTPVGTVQVALQSKACMTAHTSAGRRLFDELDSWQNLVREMQPQTLRAGVVLVNSAATFRSPLRSRVTRHTQPRAALQAVAAMSRMPRCAQPGDDGFDALGVIVLECANDGVSPVRHIATPATADADHAVEYDRMIRELAARLQTRLRAAS